MQFVHVIRCVFDGGTGAQTNAISQNTAEYIFGSARRQCVQYV